MPTGMTIKVIDTKQTKLQQAGVGEGHLVLFMVAGDESMKFDIDAFNRGFLDSGLPPSLYKTCSLVGLKKMRVVEGVENPMPKI